MILKKDKNSFITTRKDPLGVEVRVLLDGDPKRYIKGVITSDVRERQEQTKHSHKGLPFHVTFEPLDNDQMSVVFYPYADEDYEIVIIETGLSGN